MDRPFIYLASASPRRAELLSRIGIQYQILPAAIDESQQPAEPPVEYVVRMAQEKARAIRDRRNPRSDAPILGADTVVVIEGEILGKPADETEAVAILGRLSGRVHSVFSAVALLQHQRELTAMSASKVQFRAIAAEEARAYWRSGEPAGKAGAYAIQGIGAIFVERLEGSYSGVMGLPLFETARLLERCGISPLGREKGRD